MTNREFRPVLNMAPDARRMELFAWISKELETSCKGIHKITEKDNLLCHTFFESATANYDEKIKLIKEKHPITIPGHGNDSAYQFSRVDKNYYTLLYAKDTGKISLSHFAVGYAYSRSKRRYYPFKKNNTMFSYTNRLYCFASMRRQKASVFPMTGSSIATYFPVQNIVKKFAKRVYGIDFDTSLPITLDYYRGAQDEYEVIERRLGVKIPYNLKRLVNPSCLYDVLRVLKNKNEMTTLTQWALEYEGMLEGISQYGDPGYAWYLMLSEKMVGERNSSWLVRDWIRDHAKLGRKLSLRVKSYKRITDEHAKMSRKIMAKELAPIKIAKCYTQMFKKWSIPNSELITTRERLREESDIQQHCVATYGPQINSGSCAIISIFYNDERWTLQVQRIPVGSGKWIFRNVQLKGKHNKSAPVELSMLINKQLESIGHSLVTSKEYEDAVALPF